MLRISTGTRRTANDHLLDVGDVLEEGLAADEPLLAVLDDVASAGVVVVGSRAASTSERHRLRPTSDLGRSPPR
jgi:hypothetical protein